MRRNQGRNRHRAPRGPAFEPPKIPQIPENELPTCPVCGKLLKEVLSAVSYRKTGEPAHFECILAEVASTENLAEGERVCYLGSGVFGVVQERTPGNPATTVIKRTIPYESKESAQAWRRNFSLNFS